MSTNLFDLTGKLALITGSGRGIGFTLAKGLAQAGCTIVLNDIEEKRLEDAVSMLKKDGFNSFGVPFDVRDEKMIEKKVAFIEQEISKIDILINKRL